MSDGFEENTSFFDSDHGFVGQNDRERAPGSGRQSDPLYTYVKSKLTWRDRLQLFFLRHFRR